MSNAFKNPFFNFDPAKLFESFKLPEIPTDNFLDLQQKNLEALMTANQLTTECIQAVIKRQAEIVREAVEEARKLSSNIDATAAREGVQKQSELAQKTIEKGLKEAREISEMVAGANREVFSLINKRFNDSVEEIRSATKKKAAK